ncbi:HAD family hydrolase [Escherichia sp. MR]|uniref:HAD family hydrolase n=1 Tax=Escherichia sp. MR TaxID=2575922 RepID=UPI0010CA0423|nr:HAD-IA family hydrolase [Escherichia sp. MR]TKT75614.1 HAD family hydrolase [Escherichia sp. MR]
MFNCKAVIFDMNGVIIDSEGLWRQAQQGALARWGASVSDEECIRLTKGKRLDEIARTWCEYCHLSVTPTQLEAEIRRLITALIAEKGEAMPGVKDVLTFLCQSGYQLALATSSSYQVIDAVLTKLKIEHCFSVICSADDESHGKPHPAVYLSALRKLRLPAADCLVIEDSLSGFKAAQAAGIKTVVVAEDFQQPCFNSAVARYASLEQLLETVAA